MLAAVRGLCLSTVPKGVESLNAPKRRWTGAGHCPHSVFFRPARSCPCATPAMLAARLRGAAGRRVRCLDITRSGCSLRKLWSVCRRCLGRDAQLRLVGDLAIAAAGAPRPPPPPPNALLEKTAPKRMET